MGRRDPRAQPRGPPLARHLRHLPRGRPSLRRRGPQALRARGQAQPARAAAPTTTPPPSQQLGQLRAGPTFCWGYGPHTVPETGIIKFRGFRDCISWLCFSLLFSFFVLFLVFLLQQRAGHHGQLRPAGDGVRRQQRRHGVLEFERGRGRGERVLVELARELAAVGRFHMGGGCHVAGLPDARAGGDVRRRGDGWRERVGLGHHNSMVHVNCKLNTLSFGRP
ncbi:unnamed protein product [Linum tenue]|uniref:Uncharacterized protein n=1 Tax=Linum tenue TaxID=586396 RepID=A0AAV0HDE8_9ROSI|nr:unnamed protein product [Linum tenue]